MDIILQTVNINECEKLHELQKTAYQPLLEKYRDYATNPGAESTERIQQRFGYSTVNHYWIQLKAENIGYIRIQQNENNVYKLSQMFVLPEFQSRGYAQQAIQQAEALYPQAQRWELDTIKQEPKLCHLYEKMGYQLTGQENHIQPGMDLVDYAKDRASQWGESSR